MQYHFFRALLGLLTVLNLLVIAQPQTSTTLRLPMHGNVQIIGYLPGEGDHKRGSRDEWAVDLTSDNLAVYPVAPGKVVFSDSNCQTTSGKPPCYGYIVAIDHQTSDGTDNLYSIYAHLDPKGLPSVGTDVGYDTRIGTMSDSGCYDDAGVDHCGAKHLHFAVHQGRAGLKGSNALWLSDTAVNVWNPSGTWWIPGLPWPPARGSVDSRSPTEPSSMLLTELPEYPVLKPNQFTKIRFTVQNTDKSEWPKGSITLVHVDGQRLDLRWNQPPSIPSGGLLQWGLTLLAPPNPGVYNSVWRMAFYSKPFGERIYFIVVVAPEGSDASFLQTLQAMIDEARQKLKDNFDATWEDLKRQLEERINEELQRQATEQMKKCSTTPAALVLAGSIVWWRRKRREKRP